ncbi:MAG: hypothetical protein ABJB66_12905 [Gemmatimonadaceae bacterium]
MRFIVTWLSMAVSMTVNGVFRELILKRFFASRVSDVMSAIIGVVLIGLITRVGFRPFNISTSTVTLITTSVLLVVLTVVFESTLALFVDHKSWSEIGAHYNLRRGELWSLVLAFLALTPFIWGRWLPHAAS